MKSLTKEKASWRVVYLNRSCKQESCNNISGAIKDTLEMINKLDDTGHVLLCRHDRVKLENIYRCLEENDNHHDTTR